MFMTPLQHNIMSGLACLDQVQIELLNMLRYVLVKTPWLLILLQNDDQE